MAKFTITTQGLDNKKRSLAIIMQEVSRNGFFWLEVKDNVGFRDLNANELTQFKVLKREYKKGLTKQDEDHFEYSEGENFAEANIKGAFKFLGEKKKELNPSKRSKVWQKLSNNPLIVALISAFLGAIITKLFSE